MRIQVALLVLVATALSAGSDAQIAYATRIDVVGSPGDTGLYTVNLATGASTFIGMTGMDLLSGLSMSPTGQMFGADGFGDLYDIHPATAASTLIGPTFHPAPEGMDHRGADLFVTDLQPIPSLYKVDEVTGVATLFASAQTPTGWVRAMAFSPDQSLAYLIASDGFSDKLFTMTMSGAITSVGPLLNNAELLAADFDNSTGILWGMDRAGLVGKIDTTTGQFTITGNTGLDNWTDMTIAAPVPEPLTMVLGVSALAAAALRRRRRLA